MKAVWNDVILAESNDTIVLETNHYFPLDSINVEYFEKSDHTSVCGWKGTASYYNIIVHGKINADAAWYYPKPKEDAKEISNRIAFWRGVQIVE